MTAVWKATLNEWRYADGDTDEIKGIFKIEKLIEVLFEALPQYALQLYVLGRKNSLAILQIVAIITSLISVVKGSVDGVLTYVTHPKYGDSLKYDSTMLNCVLMLWLFLHLVTFLPPLSFFATLRGHSHWSFMILIGYMLLHLLCSTFFTFVFPIGGRDMGEESPRLSVSLTRSVDHLNLPRQLHQYISILLQMAFCGVSMWVSAAWFTSISPFYRNNGSIPTNLEAFYSIPLSISSEWVPPNSVMVPTGNDSGTNITSSHMDVNQSSTNPRYEWGQCNSTGGSVCLTDFALELFIFFFVSICFLFIFHFILVIIWPRINCPFLGGSFASTLISKWKKLDKLYANRSGLDNAKFPWSALEGELSTLLRNLKRKRVLNDDSHDASTLIKSLKSILSSIESRSKDLEKLTKLTHGGNRVRIAVSEARNSHLEEFDAKNIPLTREIISEIENSYATESIQKEHNHELSLEVNELRQKRFRLQYFSVKDCYVRDLADDDDAVLSLHTLAYKNDNLMRKDAKDWGVVSYIRNPDHPMAIISWRLRLEGISIMTIDM